MRIEVLLKNKKTLIVIGIIVVIVGGFLLSHKDVKKIISGHAYSYSWETLNQGTLTGGLAFSKADGYDRYSDIDDLVDDVKDNDFDYSSGKYKVKDNRTIMLDSGVNYALENEIALGHLKIKGKTITAEVLSIDGKKTYGTMTLTQRKQ